MCVVILTGKGINWQTIFIVVYYLYKYYFNDVSEELQRFYYKKSNEKYENLSSVLSIVITGISDVISVFVYGIILTKNNAVVQLVG